MQKELDYLLDKNRTIEIDRKRKLKEKEEKVKLPKATTEMIMTTMITSGTAIPTILATATQITPSSTTLEYIN